MKIAHVTEPFSGGIVTFLVYQCKYLRQYKHVIIHGERTTADHKKLVRKRFPETTQFIDWPFSHRNINPLNDLRSIFSLIKILKQVDADVIHLHSSKAGFSGRIAAVFLRKKNVIYTPHAPAFDRKDINKFKRWSYLLIEKFLFRLVPRIICCSRSEADLFLNQGMQVKYINNSIPIEEYVIKPWAGKQVVIGFIGIITQQKQPGWFNEIARAFLITDNVKFIWIGDGPLRNQLISPNVEISGWKSHSEVKLLLEQIDLFLSCGAWEGLPYAILEAMEMGKPLLLSDIPVHHDLVENSNGWIYKSPKEAIEFINHILENKDLLISKAEKSRKLAVNKFNIKKNIEIYNQYYEIISAQKS